MMRMSNDDVWAECNECGAQFKKDGTKCPDCGSSDIVVRKVVGGGTVYPRGSLRAREKTKGFGKFMKEVIQGWFSSKDPKLSKGVEKERIIDKRGDKYDEVVKDAKAGRIIHETHESLRQHKHQ